MISGKIVRLQKVAGGSGELYIILLLNSDGAIAWHSSELDKEAAVNQLLEIGLPASRIAQKFEDAEAADAQAEVAA